MTRKVFKLNQWVAGYHQNIKFVGKTVMFNNKRSINAIMDNGENRIIEYSTVSDIVILNFSVKNSNDPTNELLSPFLQHQEQNEQNVNDNQNNLGTIHEN